MEANIPGSTIIMLSVVSDVPIGSETPVVTSLIFVPGWLDDTLPKDWQGRQTDHNDHLELEDCAGTRTNEAASYAC